MARFVLLYERFLRNPTPDGFPALLLPEIAPGARIKSLRMNDAAVIAAEILSLPVTEICIPNRLSAHVAYGVVLAWRETLIQLETAEFTNHKDYEEMRAGFGRAVFGRALGHFLPNLGSAAEMVLQTFIDRKFAMSMSLFKCVLVYQRPLEPLEIDSPICACPAAIPPLSEGKPIDDSFEPSEQKPAQQGECHGDTSAPSDAGEAEDSGAAEGLSLSQQGSSCNNFPEEEELPEETRWERQKMQSEENDSVALTLEVREDLRKRKEYEEVALAVTGVLDRPFAPLRSELEAVSGKGKKR